MTNMMKKIKYFCNIKSAINISPMHSFVIRNKHSSKKIQFGYERYTFN